MAIKLNDEIIHDNDAKIEVFYNAKARLTILSENLDKAIEEGYVIRGGKLLRGQGYEKQIERMKVKLETLEELFDGENCRRYYQKVEELEDEDDLELKP